MQDEMDMRELLHFMSQVARGGDSVKKPPTGVGMLLLCDKV